jgi:hypothetical protein
VGAIPTVHTVSCVVARLGGIPPGVPVGFLLNSGKKKTATTECYHPRRANRLSWAEWGTSSREGGLATLARAAARWAWVMGLGLRNVLDMVLFLP